MTTLWLPFLLYAASWTYPAGPPEPTKGGGIAFPMTPEQYKTFAAQIARIPNRVPIRRPPPNLTPNARYGYNFNLGGVNRGWLLDGDDERGWLLYLDWNGDGDLSAVAPRRFEKIDGEHRLDVEASDADTRWPVRFRIVRVKLENEEKLGVEIASGTARRGVMQLDGKQVPFTLSGADGRYDAPYHSVTIEPPGAAPQRYKISEKRFNLFGKTYEFSVDRLGRNIAVTESAVAEPDRATLAIGSPAPSFDALAKLSGKTVLVEFWATACAPCRSDAPKNVALYKTLARDKVEFLGISSDESAAALEAFLKEFGMTWPQVREPFDGPIHRAYRVDGEPSYFLIGPSGAILDKWMSGGLAVDRLKKALAN